ARRFLHLAGRDLVQPPAVGESLQLVPAAEVELHLRDRSDQLAHDLGNQDLAALGLARDAGRDVDGGAENVAGLLDHLTGVEADADAQLPFGVLFAVLADRLLDVERALDAVARRAEADHETVAETLDPASRVLADHVVDDRLVRLHDLVRRGEAPRRKETRRLL